MKIASNEAELRAIIGNDLTRAMYLLKVKLRDELRNEIADEGIPIQAGGIGDTNRVWKTTISGSIEPELELQYDESGLVIEYNPEDNYFRHISPVGSTYGNFVDLITQGQGGYLDMFGGWANPTTRPRDFWSSYQRKLDDELDDWMRTNMRKAGMPIL